MIADQAILLRQLVVEAYGANAFDGRITRLDAELRIALLRSKLKIIDKTPDWL